MSKDLFGDIIGNNTIESDIDNIVIKNTSSKDIAIIGLSAKLPMCDSLDEFWNKLEVGTDFINIPNDTRMKDINRYNKFKGRTGKQYSIIEAAYLNEIDKFDNEFFNITFKEACLMDPYHRLFLENTWHALEDAGYACNRIRGSYTGVFLGQPINSQYYEYVKEVEPQYDFMALPGNVTSFIGSRISYILDLKGPSMMIDTACSSSLVALHTACQSLRNNECDMAIVGGINLILNPTYDNENAVKPEVMSSRGRAMTFDDSADGTGIGEGVITLILKPLKQALLDKDNIQAIIKGSACNQDGNSIGITAPNALAQKDVIIKSWEDAGINPKRISYIETHGTGTKLGDPIEIQGITSAFNEYTRDTKFVGLGALKSNIGHLDAASGLAGVLKAIMCIKNRKLVPIAHFKKPNRNIDFDESPAYVVDKLIEWKSNNGPLCCGVSSFGLSGTNCHIIIEEYKNQLNQVSEKKANVFCISAKSEDSLKCMLSKYMEFLVSYDGDMDNLCYSSNFGRSHFNYRLAIVINELSELKNCINNIISNGLDNIKEDNIYFGYHRIISSNVSVNGESEYKEEAINTISLTVNKELFDSKNNFYNDVEKLNYIAENYVKGVNIDWNKLYFNENRGIVSIPVYEFKNKRCWINIPNNDDEEDKNKMEKHLINSNKNKIKLYLKNYIVEAYNFNREHVDYTSDFFELGIDSISIIQLKQEVLNHYDIEIPIEELYQTLTNIEVLSEYISDEMGENSQDVISEDSNIIDQNSIEEAIYSNEDKNLVVSLSNQSELKSIIDSQLAIMNKQLEILKQEKNKELLVNNTQVEEKRAILKNNVKKQIENNEKSNNFFRRFITKQDQKMNNEQQIFFEKFSELYINKTRKSKELINSYRNTWANDRLIQGYSQQWKEIMYPIMIDKAQGSKIWDVDGNEYIDFSMGFGSILLGYNHPDIKKSISEAIENQIIVGPVTPFAGEVTKLIKELTKVDRVTFCNSGTEAVMLALRLARACTNKEKIVMFTGSFHGTFDGVNMYRDFSSKDYSSIPSSLGTPLEFGQHVIMLDYDSIDALDIIEKNANDIAAVIVEPVQSRRPQLQPHYFLKRLRELTSEKNILLIFDEVITGFRLESGGAQAFYDIQADIVTYGKIAGGGMPIGIVAGKEAYIRPIDGGSWNYGDDSYPDAKMITSGGTFSGHPIAMAASKMILEYIKEHGDKLYYELNSKTNKLVNELNKFFKLSNIPIEMMNCGSMFSFKPKKDLIFLRFLFYKLALKGIYLWEGATCFISEAHTDDDIEKFIKYIKESCYELAKERCFSVTLDNFQDLDDDFIKELKKNKIPLTYEQKRLWISSVQSEKGSSAFNESIIFSLKGKVDEKIMGKAIDKVVKTHDVLRTYKIDGKFMYVSDETYKINIISLADSNIEDVKEWIKDYVSKPFNFETDRLFKSTLLKLDNNEYIICMVIHHIIADGWSTNVICSEFLETYNSLKNDANNKILLPKQFSDYVEWLDKQYELPLGKQSIEYWKNKFMLKVPEIKFFSGALNNVVTDSYAGYYCLELMESELAHLREFSKKNKMTIFTTLLSAYTILLSKICDTEDMIIGIPVSGQIKFGEERLVGHCVQMLPFYSHVDEDLNFKEYMINVKNEFLKMNRHQIFSIDEIMNELNNIKAEYEIPSFNVVFNIEQSYPIDNSHLGEFEVDNKIYKEENVQNRYDLFLDILECKNSLKLRFEFNKNLISHEFIMNWAKYLKNIITNIDNNSNVNIYDIDIY